MVAKLIAHGSTREDAIARASAGLEQFGVTGPSTTIPLHLDILNSDSFRDATVTTRWLETAFLPEWQATITA